MKSLIRFAATIGVAALFAGCGGSQPPVGGGAMPQAPAITAHSDRGTSWMLPEAKSENLLYISYYEDEFIAVYSYPAGEKVGELSNLPGTPLGMCTDRKGDIFVGFDGVVQEYDHGGTSPIRTLADGTAYAWACAVDPTTGDLAVTSTAAPSGYYGNVAVYKNAKGSPKTYTNSAFQGYFGCAYDPSGNLYVTGNAPVTTEPNLFAELPKGGHTLEVVRLGRTPEGTDDVQWDGKYVSVSSPKEGQIIQFQIDGKIGKYIGVTKLGNGKDVEQFSFPGISKRSGQRASQVIGTSFQYGSFMAWNYPGGGSPTLTITSNYGSALGSVVSVAP